MESSTDQYPFGFPRSNLSLSLCVSYNRRSVEQCWQGATGDSPEFGAEPTPSEILRQFELADLECRVSPAFPPFKCEMWRCDPSRAFGVFHASEKDAPMRNDRAAVTRTWEGRLPADVIRRSPMERRFVLLSGTVPARPAELRPIPCPHCQAQQQGKRSSSKYSAIHV